MFVFIECLCGTKVVNKFLEWWFGKEEERRVEKGMVMMGIFKVGTEHSIGEEWYVASQVELKMGIRICWSLAWD